MSLVDVETFFMQTHYVIILNKHTDTEKQIHYGFQVTCLLH